MKKRLSLIITLMLIVSLTVNVFADMDTNSIIDDTTKRVYNDVANPTVASIGGEWAVIGLARGDADIPDSYFEKYYENVKSCVRERGGVLHDKKYTEYSRVILALTAIGADPENVEGYNLVSFLSDFEKTVWQGVNGPIWALIALDSGNYEIPENSEASVQATRDMYVNNILSAQGNDGGWSLTGSGESDVDITAMALCAISNYKSDDAVQTSISNALKFLSNAQNENGGFSSQGNDNVESVSQVIVSLCELGISADDSRFVKNGNTVVNGLMNFYAENGGFKHIYDSGAVNQMATEQALYALAALKRYGENKTSLYDMSDVEKKNNDTVSENQYGLPDKNADVKKREVIDNKTFSDISDHFAREQIEALASREIISGKGENVFEPDFTMTRAEFATIVTKSLALSANGEKCFEDVSENDWFFNFVSTAYKYGIVTGVSDTEFNPNGLITKEEAAVMVSRAAKLCGMDNTYEVFAVRDILAGFTDYVKTSEWSREALAFCYDNNILSDEDIEINSKASVTRAEIAVMLYNMLERAKLL